MPVASLPMYDFPEAHWAIDRFWQAVAAGVQADGLALERDRWREEQWRDPDLLFSQTCGYPLIETFHPFLTVLGAPCYDAEGCQGHDYSSAFCAREIDAETPFAEFAGRRVAVNGLDSQSGYNVLKAEIGRLGLAQGGAPFFSEMTISGSHRASVDLVREGRADIVALDAVSLAMILRHAPSDFDDMTVVGYSVSGPSLPYVTGKRRGPEEVAALRRAIAAAVADPALADAREAICLAGFDIVDADEYQRIAAITDMGRGVWLAPEDQPPR